MTRTDTQNNSAPESPLVSVVIPVFNRNDQVKNAIASVLSQHGAESHSSKGQAMFRLEVIVVDDGSHVPIVCDPDPRVTVVRHAKNQGSGAARNTGVDHALGDYVAFLDSDDTWDASKLARQVNYLQEANDEIFGVFGPFQYASQPERRHRSGPLKEKSFHTFLAGCRAAPGSTILFRRKYWNDVGPQSVTLTRFEDWDWLLRGAKQFQFSQIETGPTILGPNQRPNFDTVDRSLIEFERKWLGLLKGKEKKRLASAIAIEQSAIARAHQHWAKFIKYFCIAAFKSPRCVFENIAWRIINKA